MLNFFLSLLLASCLLTLKAQEKKDTVLIEAGNPTVNARNLLPYTNTWNIYQQNPDGGMILQGKWYDTVSLIRKSDTYIIQRRQSAKYTNGIIRHHFDEAYRDNLLCIQAKIVSETNGNITVVADVKYNGAKVEGVKYFNIDGAGEPSEIKSDFIFIHERPVYEWHLWGILISSFPLNENYAARFLTHTSPGFNSSPFLWVTLAVIGTENVSSSKWGTIECWKVKVDAEAPWTFWISKQKAVPPIQQIKIEEPGGITRWWKPVE